MNLSQPTPGDNSESDHLQLLHLQVDAARSSVLIFRMTPVLDFLNHHPTSTSVAVNIEFRGPQEWRSDFPDGPALGYVADRAYAKVRDDDLSSEHNFKLTWPNY